jgi:hypothetical protein
MAGPCLRLRPPALAEIQPKHQPENLPNPHHQVLEDIVGRGADPANIRIVCVVAAPPALKTMADTYPGAWLERWLVLLGVGVRVGGLGLGLGWVGAGFTTPTHRD